MLETVQAALDTDPPGRIDAQPGGQLNLLGWRTVGALNTLVNGSPSAFRQALQALWAEPGDAVQADAFWAALDPAVQTLGDAEKRGLAGLGTRASIASYFLFLRDPTGHPFYRPTFGGAAIEWLSGGQRRLDSASPGALLADYVDRCENLLAVFQEAGVPLQDLLDVQGALYIIGGQYPGGPRSAAGEATDPVVAEFQQFLADPVQQLRCAVRRERAAQLRGVLTAEPPVVLETFNRDVWKFESATLVDGLNITNQLFSDDLTPDRARQLDVALKGGRMELHGNYVWGSGAAIFGAALKMDDGAKQALIAQAVELIKGATDPVALAQQLDELPGFGPNISTGLALLIYPADFALYNSPSMAAMTTLNYDASTLEAFQASVSELKERVGARDFLELDWFLYCRVSPQTTWWVNQGNTYAEERAGGYVWASNETGRTLTHHTNVKLLKTGDRIIHYANKAIRAVSVVTAPANEVGDGIQSAAVLAKRGGFMARTEYQDLPLPRPLSSLPAQLRQAKVEPFDKNGNVLQGYLFPAAEALYEEVIKPGSGPAAWLFQANPKYYDLAERLRTANVGDEDEWTVTRYGKDMRAGDPVVLWLSGEEGGVYALGELTGNPAVRLTEPEWRVEAGLDTPAGSVAVPFRYTHILTPPVGRAAIDAHPMLSQMLVRRVPNGTNYKLTSAEWDALKTLIIPDDAWKDVIAEVLSASDEGLHVSVIAQRVAETGQVIAGPTSEHTVSHVLSSFPEVFEALGSGVYRLKRPDPEPYTSVPFSVIRDQMGKSGPRLDERTLRRYHLALQTRGFVVLSGVSGTGKTWLAQSYARAVGAQVQVFPVAPNWMSNEDLLGFYSPLEGGHYHHTPFSRFLLEAGAEYQAARQAGREARPYHLVLDEMNLARVEYYFAQFLSKMELRVRDGDAEIDLGPGQKALLSPNVYVIGTVNVDETTHDFADKVYDRAQLIELPVTRGQLELHLGEHAQADVILRIWDVVHPHAPFAFRVIDELLGYQRAAGELGVDPLEALDDALLQKVLPKVRGTGTGLPQALRDFLVIAERDFPLSHAKAKRMLPPEPNMASFPSTDVAGGAPGWVSWYGLRGEQVDGPREWEPVYLVIESASAPWEVLELTRNGEPLALTQRRFGSVIRTVAEWPRSNPGRYELALRHPQGVDRVTVDIAPTKISMDDFRAMLTDLQTRLPASIVLSLQRAGGLAGIDLSSVRPATVAGELHRLKRAIEGTPERLGLRDILPAVARAPHEVLEADTVMVRSELLKRPRPASLVRALATASNVGAGRQPVRLPDERVRPTRDVYENRVVQACVLTVTQRLRLLQYLAARTHREDGPLAAQLFELTGTLAQARRQARFLDDVSDLRTPPHRVTMVLLKRREYRDALGLLLELQRSLQVTLDDPRLLEPMDNLPSLYQTWCALQVIDVLLDLAPQHGYEVVQQSLARTVPGSVLLQVLPDGQPLLVLLHRASGRQVTLTPERTFRRSSQSIHSVSFQQRPDMVIEVKDAPDEVTLWLLDPKYKLDSESVAILDGKDDAPTGKPKKVDIDKMHAYRDALRDAAGRRVVRFAAILYPGAGQNYAPGLTALSAKPAASANLREQLMQHLEDVLTMPSVPLAGGAGSMVEAQHG